MMADFYETSYEQHISRGYRTTVFFNSLLTESQHGSRTEMLVTLAQRNAGIRYFLWLRIYKTFVRVVFFKDITISWMSCVSLAFDMIAVTVL